MATARARSAQESSSGSGSQVAPACSAARASSQSATAGFLGSRGAVQIGADHVIGAAALGAVLAVIAVTGAHPPEGRDSGGQRRQAGVILITDHPPEVLRLQGDVPDQSARPGHGFGVENGNAGDLGALCP